MPEQYVTELPASLRLMYRAGVLDRSSSTVQRGDIVPGYVIELESEDVIRGQRWHIGPRDVTELGSQRLSKDVKQSVEESWLARFDRELGKLRAMPPNWNSYGAPAPGRKASHCARQILEKLHRLAFAPSRLVPSVEGVVAISFIRGRKYADLECFNDGQILGVTSDGSGQPTVWEVGQNSREIDSALERIRGFITE